MSEVCNHTCFPSSSEPAKLEVLGSNPLLSPSAFQATTEPTDQTGEKGKNFKSCPSYACSEISILDKEFVKGEIDSVTLLGVCDTTLLSKAAVVPSVVVAPRNSSTVSSTSSSTSSSTIPNSEKASYLRISLLQQYRTRELFSILPIPTKLGVLSLTIKKEKENYKLYLKTKSKNIIILEGIKSNRILNNKYDIYLGGLENTSIGKIIKNKIKNNILIKIRSFYSQNQYSYYNHNKDISIDSKYRYLENAKFHTVSKYTTKHKVWNLSDIVLADTWDALQSLTGYYGRYDPSPYSKEQQQQLQYVTSSIFNVQGRSLDKYGNPMSELNMRENKGIYYIDHKNTDSIFDSSGVLKVIQVDNETYQLDVSLPLSPIQAFGIFLSSKF